MRVLMVLLTLCCIVTPRAIAQNQGDPPGPDDKKQATQEESNHQDESAQEEESKVFSIYLGEAIDTFAADETVGYLNPNDASDQRTREIGGISLQFNIPRHPRLWVFGETVHGVRSRDIDCSKPSNKELSVCTEAGFNPNDPQRRFVYLLRNASSLEAFMGVGYDLVKVGTNDEPVWLYTKVQIGSLIIKQGGDAVDLHHAGLGLRLPTGDFAGSHLEIGYGRSDLFVQRYGRYKIDGLWSIHPAAIPLVRKLENLPIRVFLQLTADVDFSSGSDSIQSYFGIDFLLKRTKKNNKDDKDDKDDTKTPVPGAAPGR